MELSEPGLENSLVRLEAFEEAHRNALGVSGAVDSMWKWMPVISAGTNYDSYFDHTLLQDKKGYSATFSIFDPKTDEFLGVVAFLNPDRTHRRIQITNIWLQPDRRGGRYYAAVQSLMIQRALEWGARRIVWLVDERNTAAKKAVAKIGAQQEGVAREYQRMTDGHWANMIVFSMLRAEAKDAVLRLQLQVSETTCCGLTPRP